MPEPRTTSTVAPCGVVAFQNSNPHASGQGPDNPMLPRPETRDWAMLAGLVGLCVLTGAVGGIATAGGVKTWYLTLVRPPLTPPEWIFGPVWTTLYVMMGTAAWLVWRRGRRDALRLWGWQLLANAIWSPVFFALHSPGAALAVILALLLLVAMTAYTFVHIHRGAGLLMMPYLGWVCFATYLNVGFWWLNGG